MSNIEQFGRYILLEKLAAGGMAEVYLSKSIGADGINKFFAIKRILPQYSDNEEFIDMFREEAKIVVNMNHNNVVKVLEFGVEKSHFYLVMEYVEGYNLRQILNHLKKSSANFSMDQIVFMIKEVAGGLDHAHRCLDNSTGKPLNIIHRDMSPQNVMISFEGEVKVVDFGIAKTANHDERTKAGTLKGKFGYMSPEQADGQPVDNRTDIFSLGIVLYELLANARLFTGDSEHAILRKIRECQITNIRSLNPSVPPELDRIVHKALTKDKSLRYQRASDMQRDLNRFLNTKYPDFSPHDFSVFMKTIFGQEFLEQRKKLVEFAKVLFEPQSPPPDLNGIGNAAANNPNAGPAVNPPPKAAPILPTIPPPNLPPAPARNNNQTQLSSTQIDKSQTGTKPPPPPPHALRQVNNQESTRSQQQDDGVFKQEVNRPQQPTRNSTLRPNTTTSTNVRNRTSSAYRQPEGFDFAAALPTILFVLLLGGLGGYLYMKKGHIRLPSFSSESGPSSETTPRQSSRLGHIDIAQTGTYVVSIQSTPSGAQIIIDGQAQNSYTPAQISVEANKEFSLGLRKEGYFPYEASLKATQNAMTFKASMQQMLKIGYISINVVNGGNAPVVSINGQRLIEKMPIKSYAVPAGVPLTIRAYNPFTGLSAEQTLVIDANQKKLIELILGINRK